MHILTLGIGKDYCRHLEKAFASKRAYALKHGYTYIQSGEEFWDRDRPISWSKVGFLLDTLSKLPDGDIVWLSDADVYITNTDLKIEDHILPLLPLDKDILMTSDACGHVNAGNILMRNCAWLRDFWKRVYEQTDCIYHIWWENAAILKLMEIHGSPDKSHFQITEQHKRFNAYLMGLDGQPLWTPGDFLVHFAGVYDAAKMEVLMNKIDQGEIPRLRMF